MHKNYRRKNPNRQVGRWSYLRDAKRDVLNQRSRRRRCRDRVLLRKTIFDDDAWEEIRKFEYPVDWWEID